MSVDIRKVKDINGLITYLAEKLSWQIDLDDFEDIEDIAYDFEAEDIGLKKEAFVKIHSLRQLPPLVDGQKWGIFCVEFDSKRFEVTALRKILSGLIPKRRNSADHAVWDQKDLLFICFWGSNNERTIGLAHFEDVGSGLPQIKMISCCPAIEDFTQIAVFEDRIKNLKWPTNYVDHEKWQEDWSSAFTTAYKQTIQDASTLTVQLAIEAQGIKKRILDNFEIESSTGYVHLLYEKFKSTLIHDMTETQFADMYAQTVVYGLFSARCMDETQDNFSASEAIECIPSTNPFLKNLMKECLGSQNNSQLSFDELEIGNIIDLLLHTKTDAIIQDFNRQTGGGREDPVIHFYEEFLTAYDKEQKVQRGVYYTPQPVVDFIVRAVDGIIKNEFKIPEGFASTATKKIKYTRRSKKRVDGFYYKDVEDTAEVPAIQVLDPATGTGTFIRQIIIQIYEDFRSARKGSSEAAIKKEWNDYVPVHLLPRINAFELMMAPYAVAHMKLAMVLKDTGYDFKNDSRLNVFLTNALEEAGNSDGQLTLWDDPLASEAISANAVKKNNGVNIIIGNPPYSISSANKGDWIVGLLSDYKKGLNERKINLDDDYIKFIRYAQFVSDKTDDFSIIAYISNNSFLDGITHREMRRQFLDIFSKIYIINLHGNSKRKETTKDGGKDENVFDIQQGVSINIFIKDNKKTKRTASVFSYDLYGDREFKYKFLREHDLTSISFERLEAEKPNYFFVPKNFSNAETYNRGFSIPELFIEYNSGVQTKRDKLVISFDEQRVQTIIKDFIKVDSESLREKYGLPADGRDWTIEGAKRDIINNDPIIQTILYRPYDYRFTAYTGHSKGFMAYPRDKIFRHFKGHQNIGLLVRRNTPPVAFTHVFICDTLISEGVLGIDPNGREYVFPLYLYPEENSFTEKTPNMNKEIVQKIKNIINIDEISCYDIFCYVYAYLHSRSYRKIFAEFLKIDFPRIPYPENLSEFTSLAKLGGELIDLHLLRFCLQEAEAKLEGDGTNIVKMASFKDGKVYINKQQYFAPVEEKHWLQMVGGYAPLQKWLKLRKNQRLSDKEIECYIKTIHAIKKTDLIMDKIEKIVFRDNLRRNN